MTCPYNEIIAWWGNSSALFSAAPSATALTSLETPSRLVVVESEVLLTLLGQPDRGGAVHIIISAVQCGWPENTVQPGHSVGISIPSSTTQHIYLHFRIQGRTEFQHCWTGGSDRYDHRIECHMRHCSWLVGCSPWYGSLQLTCMA